MGFQIFHFIQIRCYWRNSPELRLERIRGCCSMEKHIFRSNFIFLHTNTIHTTPNFNLFQFQFIYYYREKNDDTRNFFICGDAYSNQGNELCKIFCLM